MGLHVKVEQQSFIKDTKSFLCESRWSVMAFASNELSYRTLRKVVRYATQSSSILICKGLSQSHFILRMKFFLKLKSIKVVSVYFNHLAFYVPGYSSCDLSINGGITWSHYVFERHCHAIYHCRSPIYGFADRTRLFLLHWLRSPYNILLFAMGTGKTWSFNLCHPSSGWTLYWSSRWLCGSAM